VWKILSLPGFNSWTVQPVLSQYTDYTFSGHYETQTLLFFFKTCLHCDIFCRCFFNYNYCLPHHVPLYVVKQAVNFPYSGKAYNLLKVLVLLFCIRMSISALFLSTCTHLHLALTTYSSCSFHISYLCI
jgi:hypothetical protein